MSLRNFVTNVKVQYFLEGTILFSLLYLFFYWWQFTTPYISGFDGYYHIKYAYLMRTGELFQDFPWAQFSLWRDHFADKEFLFHVFLIPFTYFADLATGAKHAAVFLASAVIVNFSLILRLNKVPLRYLWIVLLLVAGDVFLYRLYLPRPHLFSMILIMWLVHAMLNKRYVLLGILSFIYPQAYTAMHMPLILAIIFCFGQYLMGEKISWRILSVTAFAILTSSLVSPFFPHNFAIFYVQNLEFAWQQFFLKVNLHQGQEVFPMSTRYFLLYNLPLLIPLCGALYLSVIHPKKISIESMHLLAMTAAFMVLTLVSKRFVEYFYPVGFFFCAFFYRDRLREIALINLLRQAKLKTTLVLFMLVAATSTSGAFSYRNLHRDIGGARASRYEEAAKFLETVTPKGETVFTCDWDDAPEMFYFNHHNKYMVFMDPIFMYSWSPEVWHVWYNVANGISGDDTAEILASKFELNYGICTKNFVALRRIIVKDPRMHIIHEDKHTYVFRVDSQQTADIQIDDM